MIVVIYRREGGSFWADSAQVPGWSVAADFLFDTMELVRASLTEMFGEDVEWRSCWENGNTVIGMKVSSWVTP